MTPRNLLVVLLGLTWIAAFVFVTSTAAGDHGVLRVVAAIAIGLPTGVEVGRRLVDRLRDASSGTRADIKRELKKSLVAISRAKVYDGDITQLSFHVWTFPRWYRQLMNSARFRHWAEQRRAAQESNKKGPSKLATPRLKRTAMYRFQRHKPSGIKFRVGQGLIGRCIDGNRKLKVMAVALDSSDFEDALESEDTWDSAEPDITYGLSLHQAEHLAESYGQVAALVLQDDGHKSDASPSSCLGIRQCGSPARIRMVSQITRSLSTFARRERTSRTA
jgi:hypothetical protein